ncbi:MAG: hypothetical protein JSS66_06555 [Armatimonadetes bacterium]|nr:hypothetical protein [Armatimonadota bacterium]
MTLYYGTSGQLARAALSDGLRPGTEDLGKWDKPPLPGRVYLSDGWLAPYYASCAVTDADPVMGLVEIDSTVLDRDKFVPDEDALNYIDVTKQLIDAGQAPRDLVQAHQALWGLSLMALGTCAYCGEVPAAAVRRIALVDTEDYPWYLWRAADTGVNRSAMVFLKDSYTALMQLAFGDPFFEPADCLDQFARRALQDMGDEKSELADSLRQMRDANEKMCREFVPQVFDRPLSIA